MRWFSWLIVLLWVIPARAADRPNVVFVLVDDIRWDAVSFKGQGQYIDPPLNIDGNPQKVTGYITDLLDRYAVEFIRKPHDKPFVLYLPHKSVHGPFTPAERHKDLYVDEPFTPPVSAND